MPTDRSVLLVASSEREQREHTTDSNKEKHGHGRVSTNLSWELSAFLKGLRLTTPTNRPGMRRSHKWLLSDTTFAEWYAALTPSPRVPNRLVVRIAGQNPLPVLAYCLFRRLQGQIVPQGLLRRHPCPL